MTNNDTLIRLKDVKNENMIASFYTKNGIDFLKQYKFIKDNDMTINIPYNWDNEKNSAYKYPEAGEIEEIEVSFGGLGNIPCIDIWVKVW